MKEYIHCSALSERNVVRLEAFSKEKIPNG